MFESILLKLAIKILLLKYLKYRYTLFIESIWFNHTFKCIFHMIQKKESKLIESSINI